MVTIFGLQDHLTEVVVEAEHMPRNVLTKLKERSVKEKPKKKLVPLFQGRFSIGKEVMK